MSINLLPWRNEKHIQKLHAVFFRVMIYGVIFCFALCAFKFLLIYKTTVYKKNIRILTHENNGLVLQDPNNKNLNLLNRAKQLYPQIAIANKENMALFSLLQTIQSDLPNSMTLTQLTLSHKNLLLQGYADQLFDIQQYTSILQRDYPKTTLSDVHTDDSNATHIDFTLTASL